MTVLIAESEGFSPDALRRLRERVDVVAADLGRDELLAAVATADVLWVRLRHQIDDEVLTAAGRLKAIVTNTTGLTHIDMEAAARRGVEVISLRGHGEFLRTIHATAELTLGLVLALARRLPAAVAHVRDAGWDRYRFKGHDLYGKTAGIVGLGRLGRIVAGYFNALGMDVLATTPERDPVDGVSLVPLDELLRRSDLITVHVDLNPGTRGLFGQREFAAMKAGAWFVNTSRGEVVDEAALLAALEDGRLKGAALDVLAGEPSSITPSHPLVCYAATHDDLIITPHIGGYTVESLDRTEGHLAGVLLDYLDRLRLAPANDMRDGVCASPRKA
jgi:D-3-phosphoglycerate dehydrogenase / 2-oxoglutarate reductase